MSVLGVVSARNVFLYAITVVALCLSFTPASAQEAITTPILQSVSNFRDLAGISASNGGTGFANTTSNNGVMRTGVFYRTNAPKSLSDADWATLSSLHIDRDIDLRTPTEISSAPDIVPRGAIYTNINIYGTPAPLPQPPLTDPPSSASNYMKGLYQGFVADPVQRAAFHSVLLTLATDSGPDLYHCSAGKDRTGWTSAILESIAGVSQATIMKDYLATNSYAAALIESTKAAILAQEPGANPDSIDAAVKVWPEYLQTALDQVAATYGSMNAYLTQGLGLTLADIYVLRAKMVYYSMLPGQSGMVGNAASGVTFLNALQNSPLSGHYTAFNYYLQSAVDAGTLGDVPAQAGGQVHADAASYLLRLPQWIDDAVAPETLGSDLRTGQGKFWMASIGGDFWSNGRNGVAGSTEYNAGTIMGGTYRFNDQTCGNLGIGYNWGSVRSADADVTINTVLATIGGRYGFSNLESGPYVTARADVGWVDYKSDRSLGGGLGNATGNTNGAIYGGLAGVGDVIRLAPFTVTLQTGVRVTGVTLNNFSESGSDLALGVNGISETFVGIPVDVDFSLDRQQLNGWSVTPSAVLGYERILTNPRIESTGMLYGFGVSQYSAFDSHDLWKAGLAVAAQRDAFLVKAGVNGLVGDGAGSYGISGQLSVSYSF